MKHLNIRVYGKVQGVFFRVSAKQEAEKLNLTGFARNEKDGTVYIEAEGEQKNLDEFLKWCKNGPDSARVDKIESTPGHLKNFSDFTMS